MLFSTINGFSHILDDSLWTSYDSSKAKQSKKNVSMTVNTIRCKEKKRTKTRTSTLAFGNSLVY